MQKAETGTGKRNLIMEEDNYFSLPLPLPLPLPVSCILWWALGTDRSEEGGREITVTSVRQDDDNNAFSEFA